MSAEYLRETAQMMREVAQASTPGPWTCYGDLLVWPSEQGPAANDPILATIGEAHDDSARHIAAWHPAVALAVADWLDDHAETAQLFVSKEIPAAAWSMNWQTSHNHALKVARVWRGDA